MEKNGITRLWFRKTGSEVNLVKKEGRWIMEPQGYAAGQNIVEGMLEKAAGLTLSALVSETESLAVYDLDPEHRIEVTAYAGDSAKRTFFVGKAAQSGRHTFVKLENEKGIYHAEGDLKSVYDTTGSRAGQWRVKQIAKEIDVRLKCVDEH